MATDELARARVRDAKRTSPCFGPHRDELVLELGCRSARVVASQGQHRLLTLALKFAELNCVAEATGIEPLLLLDDVSSELDAGHTEALFGLLGSRTNQVFVTTTRPGMLLQWQGWRGAVRVFEVAGGVVDEGHGS